MNRSLLMMTFASVTLICLPTGASFAFAECGKQQLVGTWVADFKASAESIDDPEAAEQIKQAIDSGISVVMEYKADGTAWAERTMAGKTKETTGTWKILKQDSKVTTIELVNDANGKKDELEVTFVEKDVFKLTKHGDKKVLIWRRSKD